MLRLVRSLGLAIALASLPTWSVAQEDRALVDLWIEDLSDPDPAIRELAVRHLAGEGDAIDHRLDEVPEHADRIRRLRALAEARGVDRIDAFRAAKDPEARRRALAALLAVGAPGRFLLHRALAGGPPELRIEWTAPPAWVEPGASFSMAARIVQQAEGPSWADPDRLRWRFAVEGSIERTGPERRRRRSIPAPPEEQLGLAARLVREEWIGTPLVAIEAPAALGTATVRARVELEGGTERLHLDVESAGARRRSIAYELAGGEWEGEWRFLVVPPLEPPGRTARPLEAAPPIVQAAPGERFVLRLSWRDPGAGRPRLGGPDVYHVHRRAEDGRIVTAGRLERGRLRAETDGSARIEVDAPELPGRYRATFAVAPTAVSDPILVVVEGSR